jgi:hypothetical protein
VAEEKSGSDFTGFDQGSLALMRELKQSLYQIARRAELGNHSLDTIRKQAEVSLKLIDSYLMSALSEHGQVQLDLSPMAIGSVMHETAVDLRLNTLIRRDIQIEANAHKPVMTNRGALQGLLSTITQAMSEVARKKNETLYMRSFVAKCGDVGVGVFAENNNLTAADLHVALNLSGNTHMALPKHSAKSGVMLTIADSLARALGGTLEVKRMGKYRGFATTLPQSSQLSLV